jgi:outer membrane autotransporter protein
VISLPGASWQVNAAQVGANAAQVKAGVQMALNPMTVIFANFDGEFSGSAQSYTGKAGVRVSW